MGEEMKIGGNPETQTPEIAALNKCLKSLYLATDSEVADDINRIMSAAVESLQAENKLQAERVEELQARLDEAERPVIRTGRSREELKQENATLLREKAEAWGIRFCCNRDDCNCQGQPVDPPSWWFDAQDLRSILEALSAMEGIPARQDNQPTENYVISVVATLRATAELVERAGKAWLAHEGEIELDEDCEGVVSGFVVFYYDSDRELRKDIKPTCADTLLEGLTALGETK